MNFNQNNNNGRIPPQFAKQGNQNMAPGLGPQRPNVPMLPPQLANLTPQQLQHLKNQPQFQTMMRNYMQRQQMLQQQQMVQQQQQRPQQPPGMRQPSQPGAPMGMAPDQFSAPTPGPIQGNIPGNIPGQVAGPIPGQTAGQVPGPQAMGRNQGQVLMNMNRPSVPSNDMGGSMGGPMNPNMMAMNSAASLPMTGGKSMVGPHPGSMGGVPQMPPRASSSGGKLPSSTIISSTSKYPPVPPEIANKLPLKNLSSYDEWSKKLENEGKEVPFNVKLYESIVNKEGKFHSKNLRQQESNKQLNDQLLKDLKSYNDIKQSRMNSIALSSKNQYNNSIWGEGYQGYGNGITNTGTQLILPHQRKRNSRIPESLYTERQLSDKLLKRLQANPNRHLVPIRLEFDQERDRFKLRDTFLWDLNEDQLSLEQFVGLLLEDYKFIGPQHMPTILMSIKEQIKEYSKKPDKVMGELRVPIKIDITINNTQYTDQFEWDILNFEDNDPEEFAIILCDEMNLPGEFGTAITHSIREQTQLFHKSLFLVGYSFDGSPVNEDEIRSHLLPPLRLMSQEAYRASFGSMVDDYFSILRNPTNVADYTPSLVKLTQLEVERLDKEIERESRRKRRHNLNEDVMASTAGTSLSSSGGRGSSSRRTAFHGARGGPVLPDLSDTPKTCRTPQPSSVLPGGVDLGVPDIFGYNEVIVHRSQVPNPDYKPPTPEITNQRVMYHNDINLNRFLVKIKLPM